MTTNDPEDYAKTLARLDQESAALRSEVICEGVPVMAAMCGDDEKIKALTAEQFALFRRLAKFGLGVALHTASSWEAAAIWEKKMVRFTRFDEDIGTEIGEYTCSEPGDQSGEWVRVEDYAEVCDCLKELTAMVKGECPQLLNEDSGGSARLSMRIDAALAACGEKCGG